jgi:hypothetical protein
MGHNTPYQKLHSVEFHSGFQIQKVEPGINSRKITRLQEQVLQEQDYLMTSTPPEESLGTKLFSARTSASHNLTTHKSFTTGRIAL